MELEGTVCKDGKFWLIEVLSLNLMTQGRTKSEALEMLVDAAMGLAESYDHSEIEERFSMTVTEHEKGIIGLSSNDDKHLLALSLKRQS